MPVVQMPRRGRGREAGFTLMELMVALALVALMTTLVYGGLHLGIRSWDSLDQHVAETNDFRFARGLLQRLLLEARSINKVVEQRLEPVFFGNKYQVEFVTPMSEYAGTGGLYLVRVYAESGKGGAGTLKMQRWLLHPDVLAGAKGIPEWQPLIYPGKLKEDSDPGEGLYSVNVLAREVSGLEIDYFGKKLQADRSDQGEWQEEWLHRDSLPSLVRIRMRHGDGWWPDLIVPLAQSPGY